MRMMMGVDPHPTGQARFRHKLAGAIVAALGSILIVFLRLGLWKFDLRVPITYGGDALYETTLVKALTEGGWAYHIARLGAPFGMDAVDFPIGCTLDFAILKLFSFVISNPFLLINLFWLFGIGLAAASATLFLQSLRIRIATSCTYGILYGIIPFVFHRNIAHLNLIHYIVPAGAYLGMSLACGEGLPPLGKYFRNAKLPLSRAAFLLRLGLCAAVGLTYIYCILHLYRPCVWLSDWLLPNTKRVYHPGGFDLSLRHRPFQRGRHQCQPGLLVAPGA